MNTDWQETLAGVKENMEPERITGNVRAVKGKYGFIRCCPPGKPREDYFFHGNDVEGVNWYELDPGDRVSFIPTDDERGQKALEVRLEMQKHLIKEENNDE